MATESIQQRKSWQWRAVGARAAGMGGGGAGTGGGGVGDESLSRSRLCLKDIRSLLMLVHSSLTSSQGQRCTYKDEAGGWHWTMLPLTTRATESYARASSWNGQEGPRVGTWSGIEGKKLLGKPGTFILESPKPMPLGIGQ